MPSIADISIIIWCHLCYQGTAQEFKKKFENPILRGRDADATDGEHLKGKEKLREVRESDEGYSFLFSILHRYLEAYFYLSFLWCGIGDPVIQSIITACHK